MLKAEKEGYLFAIIGTIFYALFEFISVLSLQAVSAICLLVAIYKLFGAIRQKTLYEKANRRHKEFEQLKKDLTRDHNEKSDAEAENEKSKDNVDP